MYKVFFNDRTLHLVNAYPKENPDQYDVVHPYKNIHTLKQIIEKFEKANARNMLIYFKDVDYLFKQFSSFYSLVYAAGGLVNDPRNRVLLIYRRGKWDLPKGKTEPHESFEETAVREVSEETHVKGLNIETFLIDTYHTYYIGNKPILKKTKWYSMRNHGKEDLIPQVKEDITHAKWVAPEELKEYMKNTYPSICEVIAAAGLL